jgi:alanyl-tRNA synthetase
VHPEYLRFDFAHYQKLSSEEIRQVEQIVNRLIRQNQSREEWRDLPIEQAKERGALALFGEKYGDAVRMIKFGDSVELCGGTHVPATGQIGLFKIVSESAIAAGVRRIEAVTGEKAEDYYANQTEVLNEIKSLVKNLVDPVKAVKNLLDENAELKHLIEKANNEKVATLHSQLSEQYKQHEEYRLLTQVVNLDPNAARNLAFKLLAGQDDLIIVLGSHHDDKPLLTVAISELLVKEKQFSASEIIKVIAKEIKGGGGGQAHFATAGGKDSSGLNNAILKAEEFIVNRE